MRGDLTFRIRLMIGQEQDMLFAMMLQLGGDIGVSKEHPLQSISLLLAFFTFFYGAIALPLLGLAGGAPLLSAAVRSSRLLRWLCIATLLVPVLLLLNLLGWFAYFPLSGRMDLAKRTHTIHAATLREGVSLPAGSSITEPAVGNDWITVVLASPTMADGIEWTGKLQIDPDRPGRRLSGTMTQPHVLRGIPCGPGPATISDRLVDCKLGRDTVLQGFTFAAGTQLEWIFGHKDIPDQVGFGTLAQPLRYAGALWPAGMRIAPQALTLSEIENTFPVEGRYLELCVPHGHDATFAGATLRGPVDLEFNTAFAQVTNQCETSADAPTIAYGSIRTPDGSAHRSGQVPYRSTAWTWSDQEVPADHMDTTIDSPGRWFTGTH